jgi:signal transduction histidine kinase
MKPLSLRARFVAIVLAGAILPLAIVGFWLARSSVDTTADRLQAQLQAELERLRAEIERRWQYRLGDILLLAENEETLAFLRRGQPPDAATAAYLDSVWAPNRLALPAIEYRGPRGEHIWRLAATEAGLEEANRRGGASPTIAVPLDVRDPASGQLLGSVVAQVRARSLSRDSLPLSMPGARLLIRHRPTGAAILVTTELPAAAAQADRFRAEGEDWVAARRSGSEPPIELTAARPITLDIAPYRRAARIGALALLLVALLVSAFIYVQTGRMTRGLQQLAATAQAVGAGDLHARVDARGDDEVARVSAVFNGMAENLERTLSELAQQRALATIGEFAATLSHEVRNALTSVRIDLERASQTRTGDAERLSLATRALANTARLESIVSGLLRVARSSQTTLTPIDLLDPLYAAISSVMVQSPQGGIRLDHSAAAHTTIAGDRAALEQLFTNLILNAVEANALTPSANGDQHVRVAVRNDGPAVVVDVHDAGPGIAPDQRERVFQAFVTTKPNGTGLGLAIARNIARSMNGDVVIVTTGVDGTTMRSSFPTD